MYHSRTEKIMQLAQVHTNSNSNNSFEPDQVDKQASLSQTNEISVQCLSVSGEQKDFTVLLPLEILPPPATENIVLNETLQEQNEIVNLSASTSNLIDECLLEEEAVQVFHVTTPPSSKCSVIHDKNEQSSIKTNTGNGFVCFHCSLEFANKKNLRHHIIYEHMGAEQSSSEDDVTSENDGVHQHRKKKQKTDNRSTTVAKRQERKCLRVAGKAYNNVKGNKVKGRERKDDMCCSVKCPFKCSQTFSASQKDDCFFAFWKMGEDDKSQDRQRQYIASHIEEVEPQRRRTNTPSRKKRSLQYYLEKDSERVRVCRSFFLAVCDITEKFVRVCLTKKNDAGVVSADRRGKKQAKNKTPSWIEQHAREHILSIPKVESHYCRQSSNKLYLSSQLNLEKLYSLYLEKCQEDNLKVAEENKQLGPENKKVL